MNYLRGGYQDFKNNMFLLNNFLNGPIYFPDYLVCDEKSVVLLIYYEILEKIQLIGITEKEFNLCRMYKYVS